MVEKFIKFIKRSPNKKRFEKVLQDILDNNLDWYHIQSIKGKQWYFRLRIWSVRFIYKTTKKWNVLINVNNRWDIYKNI